jgi:hypothetical protein
MTSDPSNAEVIDAVTMELSRFSRDVVTEVHRLRDELGIEKQRVTALEAEVAELRRTRTPSVSPDAPAQPVAQPVAEPVVEPVVEPVAEPVAEPAAAHAETQIPPSHEPEVVAPATIEFVPLTLHAAVNPVPTSAGLDNLARVLAELSEPIAVAWPTDS